MQTPRPYVMSRHRALWMGVLAMLPLLLFGLVFVAAFALFASEAFQPGAMRHHGPPPLILLMFPVHCLLMVTWVTGMVLFIIDVFRNPHVPENQRPLWMVLFFFVGFVTVPVYWFLYVWQPLRRAGGPEPVQP